MERFGALTDLTCIIPTLQVHRGTRFQTRDSIMQATSSVARNPSGQSIGSWVACHEFEPSTTEDPPCRGAMHVKSVESSKSSRWCGSWESGVAS
ncbi:hypothetical protein TNCV_2418651 [Trichonephila clavipes]|nr:hypothetical protein TNCV_2418651 [Trichonephila clavipes]